MKINPDIPINHFNHCPNCGSDNISLHEKNSIYCRNCSFTYFFNTASAVAAIIFDKESRLLLTVRGKEPGKNLLDLPGGFVDPGESAEVALAREIFEELNAGITGINYFASFPNSYSYKGVIYSTMDIYFTCSVKDMGALKPGEEIGSYVFLKPHEIDMDMVAFESTRLTLKKLL